MVKWKGLTVLMTKNSTTRGNLKKSKKEGTIPSIRLLQQAASQPSSRLDDAVGEVKVFSGVSECYPPPKSY
jgi:hypothetical protein